MSCHVISYLRRVCGQHVAAAGLEASSKVYMQQGWTQLVVGLQAVELALHMHCVPNLASHEGTG